MSKFSIIVPVYNVMPYLSQCVESIEKQSFQDYELILVDDGSTDGSGALCDELAVKYGNIQVVHQENSGHVATRKTGIQKATGEYILCADSDDYLDSDLLLKLEEIIDAHHPDVVAFDFYLVTEEGEILSVFRNKEKEGLYIGEKLDALSNRCIYDKAVKNLNNGNIANSLWSKVFRRDCIAGPLLAAPDGIKWGGDIAVTMPALCACNSLYIYHYPGYYYRQRTGSVVHSFRHEEIANRELLISHLYENTPKIDKANVDLYSYVVFSGFVGKAVAFSKTYIQFRDIMRLPHNKAFVQGLCKIDDKYLPFKEKIKLYCMKRDLWFIFWMLKT